MIVENPREGVQGRTTFVEKINMFDLLDRADPSVRRQVAALFEEGHGVAVFENIDMWSSRRGQRSFVKFGPSCTYQTIEEIAAGHLGDLPSERQYPVAYTLV